MTSNSEPRGRIGRVPATTRGELSRITLELFLERGFENTTMSDIAEAVGISRRTLFRYFDSKNDLPWGDFDAILEGLRDGLRASDPEAPLVDCLREAIVDFNRFPDEDIRLHRGRMELLFNVPTLAAHSTLRYAAWRRVIADFVAERLGEEPESLIPRSVGWATLGVCMSAYEQWLANPEASLTVLLDSAFQNMSRILTRAENAKGAEHH